MCQSLRIQQFKAQQLVERIIQFTLTRLSMYIMIELPIK